MRIKNYILVAFILLLVIPFANAGEKKDIVEAIKINKIAEILDLDENMISQLIKMETNLKKVQKDYQKKEIEIVSDLEIAVKESEFNKTDDLIEKLEKLERERLEEVLKVRKDYAKKLSKEKRAKYILFEMKFRATLKEKIIEKIK